MSAMWRCHGQRERFRQILHGQALLQLNASRPLLDDRVARLQLEVVVTQVFEDATCLLPADRAKRRYVRSVTEVKRERKKHLPAKSFVKVKDEGQSIVASNHVLGVKVVHGL